MKATFAATTGHTVPIETAVWGGRLKDFIRCSDAGVRDEAHVNGQMPTTRWQWCSYWAATVPDGRGAHAPGLNGEVGVRNGTNGNFDAGEEARQIHADFTVGQIPFYNYRYRDGHVLHNTQHIWDGEPLGERMAGLFQLFPRQDTH